jgi:hypothetical protein
MHSDGKKRRSFLALLFAAGDAKREHAAEAASESRTDLSKSSRAQDNPSLPLATPVIFAALGA